MFTIANILTGFNLSCGVLSIIFTFSGRLEWAVFAIILGAIFDFFDGFTARLLKQPSELGKQLDSLADVVTFGVAPGVLVFILFILSAGLQITGGNLDTFWLEGTLGSNVHHWISLYLSELVGNYPEIEVQSFSTGQKILPFIALLIPFFSMFRLAKFNLDVRQATGFIGLPTPANSIFFASFALLIWDGFDTESWKSSFSFLMIQPSILIPLVLLFSYLLIAEIPLFSLKFSHFKWKENEIRFIFILLTIGLLATLQVWALPLIIVVYILLSFVANKGKAVGKTSI